MPTLYSFRNVEHPWNDLMISCLVFLFSFFQIRYWSSRFVRYPSAMPQAAQELPATGKSLQLFHHQVAGQSLVFQYDERTICKTLIPREDLFYRNVPDILKPFIPTYRGTGCLPCLPVGFSLLSEGWQIFFKHWPFSWLVTNLWIINPPHVWCS